MKANGEEMPVTFKGQRGRVNAVGVLVLDDPCKCCGSDRYVSLISKGKASEGCSATSTRRGPACVFKRMCESTHHYPNCRLGRLETEQALTTVRFVSDEAQKHARVADKRALVFGRAEKLLARRQVEKNIKK